MASCCAVLVCLSTCGFVSGNRARLSERAASPSTRPLGVYIYAVGPRSCRIRRAQKGSAPLIDIAFGDSASLRGIPAPARNKAALGTLGSSARCSGSRPHSRSLRRRSRRLRGDTRRNASSAGYRLLALRRVSPRIRRTASLHVAQFGTRPLVPCLTFHKVRFSSQHLRSPTFRQLA